MGSLFYRVQKHPARTHRQPAPLTYSSPNWKAGRSQNEETLLMAGRDIRTGKGASPIRHRAFFPPPDRPSQPTHIHPVGYGAGRR
jgi:hypothetical protein